MFARVLHKCPNVTKVLYGTLYKFPKVTKVPYGT